MAVRGIGLGWISAGVACQFFQNPTCKRGWTPGCAEGAENDGILLIPQARLVWAKNCLLSPTERGVYQMKFRFAGALYLTLCAAAFAEQVLTNESVEKMAKARLGDDVIVSMIQSQAGHYEVTPEALIALKKKGISDKVLAALVARSNTDATAPSAAVTAPVAVAADPYEELDIGIYRKVRQTWTPIASEPVNWKTSGRIKGLITDGSINKGVTGRLIGGSSPTQMQAPLAFLIKTADGVDATDFQLVLLHDRNDDREFRTLAGKTQDQIGFEQTRIAKRTYEVVLPGHLAPGEYAFLAPGLINPSTAGSIGKAYTFRVVE
jgi:hypothetical protein